MTKYSVNHRIYLSNFGTQRPAADAARKEDFLSLMGLLTFIIKNPLTSASVAAGWVAVGYAGYYAYKTGSWISLATSPKTYIQASQEILEGTADVATNVAKKVSSVPGDIAEKMVQKDVLPKNTSGDFVDYRMGVDPMNFSSAKKQLAISAAKTIVKFGVIGGVIASLSYSVYSFWPSSQ